MHWSCGTVHVRPGMDALQVAALVVPHISWVHKFATRTEGELGGGEFVYSRRAIQMLCGPGAPYCSGRYSRPTWPASPEQPQQTAIFFACFVSFAVDACHLLRSPEASFLF